ncbi:hypothetical protein [Caulobacter sp. Root1472]|uniref:hypothetical protein n=1 Tax=Caulobacter sp. Root1472 TaxID=1736470 RepID=UPI0012E35EF8|nr:hypothetical protein [Caulobacter sp. Root1472]
MKRGLGEEERRIVEAEIEREAGSGITEQAVWVPHWDHTGDRLKIMAMCGAVGNEIGSTVTAHIGAAVIERASTSKLGFASYMRDCIQKSVRSEFARVGMAAPDYFFVVEDASFGACQGGEALHLHGAYCAAPEGLERVRQRRTFRRALKAALGAWKGGRRQVQITETITTPWKWARYLGKHVDVTGNALTAQGSGNATLFATNGMRQKARAWYDGQRSQ